METFSWINFWMVILCVCLPAKSRPFGEKDSIRPSTFPRLKLKVDSNINMMQKNVKCEQDSKFYTPKNIKPECLIAALQCFKVELQTVSSECEDPEEVINGAIEFLQNYIGKLDFTACPCEGWSEKPFPAFLEHMKTLIQLINSQAS